MVHTYRIERSTTHPDIMEARKQVAHEMVMSDFESLQGTLYQSLTGMHEIRIIPYREEKVVQSGALTVAKTNAWEVTMGVQIEVHIPDPDPDKKENSLTKQPKDHNCSIGHGLH